MKNAKKLLSVLILGTVICTHTYNVYQTCYASEAVVAGGLASAGAALLGLGAIAGVGMELENNRRFNELSDEEKQRIENGLVTNFEDVALQRGASVEKIKNWTTDLCSGVLDKTSECWGIFKDWVKNIDLKTTEFDTSLINGQPLSPDCLQGMSYTDYDGHKRVISASGVQRIKEAFNIKPNDTRYIGWMVYSGQNVNGDYVAVVGIANTSAQDVTGATGSYNIHFSDLYSSGGWYNIYGSGYVGNHVHQAEIIICSKPVVINGYDVNLKGTYHDIFSTNTDYLEKLKGQDEDVIDVIDVTDIKNPIVETRPNSLARIDWNRGTRRTNNNNDDDDNKMVTGLVPMDVWYEQIDDEQEQMQNAVVVYNNYIQEHPEEKDTYFISTTPVTNINNYFNTLPVVNLPAQGTVVNNYYEYNNYNNNNTTIYELPYNTELVPQIPTMIFENKFPFCIPFDIYQFFAMFYVEKEAPRIVVPVPFKGANGVFAEDLTIDLSDYNYVSDVLRVMLYLLFIVGLMVATRRLIKG